MELTPRRWTHRLAASVLVLTTLAVYAPTLDFAWVGFDDVSALGTDRQDLGGLGNLLSWTMHAARNPAQAPLSFVSGRQLTNLSHAFDAAVFGDDPWGHRLHNVLLHLAAALAAGAAAETLLGSIGWGLFVALVFALHPLQTESVVYIAGRRDVLSGMLGLAGFALWAKARSNDTRAALLVSALWMAALCAKPSAIAWPAVAWAHDHMLRPAVPSCAARRTVPVALFALIPVLVYRFLNGIGEEHTRMLGPSYLWYGGGPIAQWATEPRLLLLAAKLTVWPFPQCADYSWQAVDPSRTLADPRTVAALLCLAAAGTCAVRVARRDPVAGFALTAAALSYLPMMPVLPMSHNVQLFAEHWLYIPLFGAALAAARFLQRFPKQGAAVSVAAFLIAGCAAANMARAQVWRGDLIFWNEAARVQPSCARAYSGIADALARRGLPARAETLYRRALVLNPENVQPFIALAHLKINEGRLSEARKILLEARRLPAGRASDGIGLAVQYELGYVALLQGAPREALRQLYASFTAPARDARGWAHIAMGEWDAAVGSFRDAVWEDPYSPKARADLGMALLNTGRPQEAVETLRSARRLDPSLIAVQINLGLALARTGRVAEGRALLTDAARREPRSADVCTSLSETERLAGLKRPALSWARRAVALGGSALAYRQMALAMEAR